MPPPTAELLGYIAVIVLIAVVAIVVDPAIRARRQANALTRVRRHAAAGCRVCATALRIGTDEGELAARGLTVPAKLIPGRVAKHVDGGIR